jgi:hypothetical protein
MVKLMFSTLQSKDKMEKNMPPQRLSMIDESTTGMKTHAA